MTDELDLSETTLAQRLVLLGVLHLDQTGETPAHTIDVIHACTDHLDDVDADLVGDLSEAEVSRALNRLEADGFVRKVVEGERSAVGKGRPTYALQVDEETLLDDLADDRRVVRLVDHIRDAKA
jgi:predicted transcriptional regulator